MDSEQPPDLTLAVSRARQNLIDLLDAGLPANLSIIEQVGGDNRHFLMSIAQKIKFDKRFGAVNEVILSPSLEKRALRCQQVPAKR